MSLLDTVWSEKYRPETLDEMVLTKDVRTKCQAFIDDNQLPNLLLASKTPGIGKTTLAKVLSSAMNYDVLAINGSSDRNIDTLRGNITDFASAFSLSGNRKVVLIDEADYLNPTSTQPALRNFIQEYSSNCSFIFTCNYKNKIIDPLRSRFAELDFDPNPENKKELKVGMLQRAALILDSEKVKYDMKIVAHYINSYYPDFRSAINELQIISKLGPIVTVVNSKEGNKDELLKIIKARKFKDMLVWVSENHTLGIDWIADVIYKNVDDLFEPEGRPTAIALAYDYCYKDRVAVNPELCISACLSEIFLSC